MSGDDAFRALDLAVADECRLNVLWLHGDARGERALEVVVPGLSLQGSLATLYRHVLGVPYDASGPPALPSLPAPDASLDLVTLYGRRPSRLLLGEMHRVLRKGGTALLAAENRWWYGRWRSTRKGSSASTAARRLERAAMEAGFSEARTYWVEPSLATPRNLIPVRDDRVREFEATRAREWGAGRWRSLVLSAKLDAVLYPALTVVAKA